MATIVQQVRGGYRPNIADLDMGVIELTDLASDRLEREFYKMFPMIPDLETDESTGDCGVPFFPLDVTIPQDEALFFNLAFHAGNCEHALMENRFVTGIIAAHLENWRQGYLAELYRCAGENPGMPIRVKAVVSGSKSDQGPVTGLRGEPLYMWVVRKNETLMLKSESSVKFIAEPSPL